MLIRAAGAGFLLLALMALGLSVYGLSQALSMALQLESAHAEMGISFDAGDWIFHWRLWNSAVVGWSILAGTAGTCMIARVRSGFLFASIVAMVAAWVPWALLAFGFVSYGFEQPSFLTTLVFLVIGAWCLWKYFSPKW